MKYYPLLTLALLAHAQIDPRLMTAIAQNDTRAVKAALRAGANPSATDSLGASPLMWACYQADTAVVQTLVQVGAKIQCCGVIRTDSSTYYGNLTGLAAGLNKLPLLRYLLETLKLPVNEPEYNPETKKNDGWTPAEWAASGGHLAVLTYLAKHRADLSVGNGNPLVLAAQKNQSEALLFPFYYGQTLQKNHPIYGKVAEACFGLVVPLAKREDRKGHYVLAARCYEQLLGIYGENVSRENADYAILMNDMGYVYHKMGQYEKALPLYQQCLSIQEGSIGKDHPDYNVTLNNLANLYNTMGQYEKALPLYERDLDITEKAVGKDHPEYARCLNNMASPYYEMGQFEKAQRLYEQCLSIQEKVPGIDHPDYAMALNNLALLYQAIGQYEKALPLYKQCLNIQEKVAGKGHPDYATALNSLAKLYEAMKQYKQAISLAIANRQQYKVQLLQTVGILNESASLAFQKVKGNPDFTYSLGYVSRSVALAGQHYSDALLSTGVGLIAAQQISRIANETTDTTARLIAIELRDTKQHLIYQRSLSLSQQQNADLLDKRVTQLEQQLVLRLPDYAKAFNALRVEWSQVQQGLRPDEAAIEFVAFRYYHRTLTDSTLYAALVLRPGYIQPKFVFLGEQRQLNTLLIAGAASPEDINGLYRGAKVSSNSSQLARGLALSKLIWQPLDSLLQGVKTIFVSPAGRLHQIALAALPNPADTSHQTRMADRFQIWQVGSTRVVALRKDQTEQLLATKTLKTSLYGGMTYESDSTALVRQAHQDEVQQRLAYREATRSGTWDYLPGTQIEVDKLNQLLPPAQTTLLTKEAATEASVKAWPGHSPTILHIATQGFFFPDLPKSSTGKNGFDNIDQKQFEVSKNPLLRSGLVMAGANYVWKGGTLIKGVEDGILAAYEVSNMNLRGTELVVLIACETALGKVQGSEGVYGLQRAFKMAGVRYLLMSLWHVSDKETVEYMALLYSQMLRGCWGIEKD